jgi:hypothetical protein
MCCRCCAIVCARSSTEGLEASCHVPWDRTSIPSTIRQSVTAPVDVFLADKDQLWSVSKQWTSAARRQTVAKGRAEKGRTYEDSLRQEA